MNPESKFVTIELLSKLTSLIKAAGTESFYSELIEFMAGLVNCSRWLVMRYPRYAQPEFIVNNAMSDEAIKYYNAGLYHADPLFHLTRSNDRDTIIVLSQLDDSQAYSHYLKTIFTSAEIFDELAIIIGGPGQVNIALTLDRSTKTFNDEEINLIEIMLPLVSELNSRHVNRVFLNAIHGSSNVISGSAQKAIWLKDNMGNTVFQSPEWIDMEKHGHLDLSKKPDDNSTSGEIKIDDEHILHWEQMDENFAIAPSGTLYVVESNSLATNSYKFSNALEHFSTKCEMTSREKDIVDLVFKGYPNSLIATKLKISEGTVRNHRHRLYYKLNITSERELFSQFLDEFIQKK